MIAETGGKKTRMISLPEAVITAAGVAGSALHKVGFKKLAMTKDKAGELLARHWTAKTRESMRSLGCEEVVPFSTGAEQTWEWYRKNGWLS
jgi:hypothetical protein